MGDLVNTIVIDIWKDRSPRIIGQCAGCYGDIYDTEQVFQMQTEFGTALIHNDACCCHQFVIENAIKKDKKRKIHIHHLHLI